MYGKCGSFRRLIFSSRSPITFMRASRIVNVTGRQSDSEGVRAIGSDEAAVVCVHLNGTKFRIHLIADDNRRRYFSLCRQTTIDKAKG